MQSDSLTEALASFIEIALTGQVFTQVSQPLHAFESTFAAILILLGLLIMTLLKVRFINIMRIYQMSRAESVKNFLGNFGWL